MYKSLRAKNVIFISEINIWDSLAYIHLCKRVIAVDSAIKTYSAILKIPTLVFISSDFKDEYRDKRFIEPYKGIIYPMKYFEFNEEILMKIKSWLACDINKYNSPINNRYRKL